MASHHTKEASTLIKRIIEAMVLNIHTWSLEMYDTKVVPHHFDVYLHHQDYREVLSPVESMVTDQAKTRLNVEFKAMKEASHRAAKPPWLYRYMQKVSWTAPVAKRLIKQHKKKREQKGVIVDTKRMRDWEIEFFPRTPGQHASGEEPIKKRGDIFILSRLTSVQPGTVGGNTVGMSTIFSEGKLHTMALSPEEVSLLQQVAAPSQQAQPYARITYQDKSGQHVYEMTQSPVKIGRGGPGYYVDIQLDAPPEVAPEHLRIRRDEQSEKIYIYDTGASPGGVTLEGNRIPVRREVPVQFPSLTPAKVRIGLANAVVLDLERA